MDRKLDEVRGGEHPPEKALRIKTWSQAAVGDVLRVRSVSSRVCRWTTHAAVLGLGLVTVAAGGLPAFPGRSTTGLPTVSSQIEVRSLSRPLSSRGGTLVRAAVPHTAEGGASTLAGSDAWTAISPAQSRGIQTYTVQAGDTLIRLAEHFDVTPETILSANPSLAGNPDLLHLGQELLIPPVSGVLHEVQSGDTLNLIAQKYKVDPNVIIGYAGNHLSEPYTLQLGQKLMVPGGVWTIPKRVYAPSEIAEAIGEVQATGSFIWPTTGRLTQGVWAGHVAIDLATPTGTPIYAADTGVVVEAGWTDVGYGNYVSINHGNGYRTLYAHMSRILVQRGQLVQKGDKIGLVGSTGRSTGPHLHFEIYKNGALQSPLDYLP